jgi:hypothetical protein
MRQASSDLTWSGWRSLPPSVCRACSHSMTSRGAQGPGQRAMVDWLPAPPPHHELYPTAVQVWWIPFFLLILATHRPMLFCISHGWFGIIQLVLMVGFDVWWFSMLFKLQMIVQNIEPLDTSDWVPLYMCSVHIWTRWLTVHTTLANCAIMLFSTICGK